MKRARTPTASAPSSPTATIDGVIHTIRGERVILDVDLAGLYGVETKALNRAAQRNRDKFPPDFMFQLTATEHESLRRQIGTSKASRERNTALRSQTENSKLGRGGRRYLPYAFTEHGAIMAANILHSPQATQMSVFVVRTFIKMRSLLTDTRELAKKLTAIEEELTARLDSHETSISEFMRRIMLLLDPPAAPEIMPKEMGYHTLLKTGPKRPG